MRLQICRSATPAILNQRRSHLNEEILVMLKRKKILSGIFALVVGLSLSLPMRASADDHHWYDRHEYDHHERMDHEHARDAHFHEWRWEQDHDHYRAYTYAPEHYNPVDGAGMRDPRNPNIIWACDADGHHCHWAPR